MRLLKNLSIKQLLTIIIMSISGISVLLTTLAISAIGIYSLQDKIISDMRISAAIVGDHNTAPILFDDPQQATENLNVYSVQQDILQVCLYNSTGEIFAHYYNKEKIAGSECPSNLSYREILKGKYAEVMQEITKHEEKIGYIYIQSSLEQVDSYIEKQTEIALFVVIAVLGISYMLALLLQRGISTPILRLADIAKQVSQSQDYTIRAEFMGDTSKEFNNELGILTDSFNKMLSEVEARNFQLEKQYSELEKTRDAAETANRAKSHFLANISHELRTPLNAIIGFSSILMNQLFGALGDAKYLEYAKDINESGSHLLEIINDILDLSKAEAGKLILNYEEVYISKAISKCITIISDRANKGKVKITTDVSKMLPPLLVDRLRFVQILLNVISNAVKFTPEGGSVHISVATKETEGEVTEFIIKVQDTGIGMSNADIEHAFQSFGQVDSGLNRKYEGTGLGLPLTQKLLELHYGNLKIESDIGKGTLVTLSFPAVPPISTTLSQVSICAEKIRYM